MLSAQLVCVVDVSAERVVGNLVLRELGAVVRLGGRIRTPDEPVRVEQIPVYLQIRARRKRVAVLKLLYGHAVIVGVADVGIRARRRAQWATPGAVGRASGEE